jgi:hypothetical protein
MKSFVHFFSGIVVNFSRWLFPVFYKEQQSAKFLIPLPVFNKIINRHHILLIPMICTVMYQGKVSAKNIETQKPVTASVANTNFESFQRPTVFESLITNLYANVNNVYNLADGNMVIYDDAYSNSVDGADARKLTNWGENFGMVRDNITLAVEKRKVMRSIDTVFYDMSNLRNIPYKLEIQGSNLNHPGMVGFLEDVFLGTRIALSLTETTRYLFNVSATAGSSARNRFRAIFFTISSGPLPVSFTSINAKKIQNKTTINWQVSNQLSIQSYQVQSSINGTNFTAVGNVSATINSSLASSYQWTDEVIATGTKYYRVLSIDMAGNNKYSPVVVINGSKNIAGFSILANPVQGNDVKVSFTNKEKGDYSIRVFNGDGKMIFSSKTMHTEGTTTYSYALPPNTMSGNYFVEIADVKNTRQVLPVVILNQ